mmetsp:Transcript_15394/g.37813  ORF Transcript_15394/g.37813 Transcript_15394/m.37813 type:complete len:276 (-) Transcript_15394:471-1298(-)
MCCCCGSAIAHGASFTLLVLVGIFIVVGWAGADSKGAVWGASQIDYDVIFSNNATSKCEENYFWGLTQYTVQIKSCAIILSESEKTFSYDGSDCDQDYCDPCKNAGGVIVFFITASFLAIVGVMAYIVYILRQQASEQEAERGISCTKDRQLLSLVLTGVCIALYLTIQIWVTPCQNEINDFIEDSANSRNANYESTIAGAYATVFTGWILALIAAGNQCCYAKMGQRNVVVRNSANMGGAPVYDAQPVRAGGIQVAQAVPVEEGKNPRTGEYAL